MSKKKEQQNYLDLIPSITEGTRHEVREDNSTVVFIEWKGFYHTIAQKLFHRPRFTEVTLDAYGACVWNLIDGRRTVYEIVSGVSDTFPDMEDALVRVIRFLEILRENHLIAWKGSAHA